MRYKIILLVILFRISEFRAQEYSDLEGKIEYCDGLLLKVRDVYNENPDSSYFYAEQALHFSTKNKLDLQEAEACYSLAKTEVLKGSIESALEHLKRALQIFLNNDKRNRAAKCYDLMSTAFSKIDKDGEGVFLLIKACDIYREIGDEQGLMSSLTNLANDYAYLGEYENGLEALAEAKQYIQPNSIQWFYYYINLGIIYRQQKKYDAAKIQLDSCLNISRRHKMLDAEITAFTDIASILVATNKIDLAITYYTKAITMARDNNLPLEELDALNGIIVCYENTKNYKNAFTYQSRLKRLSDSLFTIKKVKNVNDIERRLKLSEKERTIALQKLNIEAAAREEEVSKSRIVILIIGTICLGIAVFFIWIIYVRTRKQKVEVELQKMQVERLNVLNQKIFSVIAHDFKSPLITLQMLMDLLDKENVSQEDLTIYTSDVRHQITQSNQILENLLNWARTELNITQNKNLVADAHLLAEEIKRELKFMTSKKVIEVVNKIPQKKMFQIPPDILRIALRNLVSNAIKYSYEKSKVCIGLTDDGEIFVSDEGIGIKEEKMNELFTGIVKSKLGTYNETGFGLGLHITFELISKFGGTIRAKSNIPKGTVFIFTLPAYD